jgi:phosphoglycerol transferase
MAWAALLACGIVDHNSGAAIRGRAAETQAERHAVESFVRTIEAELPAGAAILMLPITPFPLDPGRGQMLNFDHAKPYLFSSRLRWSWPTFGPRHERLAAAIGGPDAAGFTGRIRGAGFDYIWVDRAAPADEVAALETAITTAGGRLLLDDPAGRYRVYAIGDVAPAPTETPS